MKKSVMILFFVFLLVSQSFAIDDIKFSAGMTQAHFKSFSEQLGVALTYKPVSPAEPLGLLGFDLGVEVSAIDVGSSDWKYAMKDNDGPSIVGFPKLHAIVGLPADFDIGVVYSQIPDTNIRYWGGEIKYAILEGTALTPALAVRGTYTQLDGVPELKMKTYGAEASVSKGFAMLTPYAGLGYNWIISDPQGFPKDVLGLDKETIETYKAYLGAQFTILFFALTGEVEFNKITPVYSLKAGIVF